MSTPGFSAEYSLIPGAILARGIGQSSEPVGIVPAAAPQWGSATGQIGVFQDNGCVDNQHQYTARLWNIPWGQSWDTACRNTPAPPSFPPGVAGRTPDTCNEPDPKGWFGEWGIWNVNDSVCTEVVTQNPTKYHPSWPYFPGCPSPWCHYNAQGACVCFW